MQSRLGSCRVRPHRLTSRVATLVVGFWAWSALAAARPPAWQLAGRGLNEVRIVAIAVDPRNSRLLVAASAHAVYLSRDGGSEWREGFRTPQAATITFLAIDPFDSQHVLAATTNGLYGSFDGARRWERLFRGLGEGEAACHVAAFHPAHRHTVYVGTAGGLFVSTDGGRRWREASTSLTHQVIRDLAIEPTEPHRLYALTDRGVFVDSGELDGWERLFEVTSAGEEPEESDGLPEEVETESESSRRLTAIAIDPQAPETLYLASSDGLFVSQDRGAGWQRASSAGFGTPAVHRLALHAHSPTVIYAATSQGIVRYHPDDQRWEPLVAGLPTQDVNFVAASPTKVYAATGQGLYLIDLTQELLEQNQWPAPQELLANFVHEPTMTQVREEAIRYAEVHPDKIKQWRRQASLKALLPSLDFAFDRNKSIDDSIDEGSFPNFQTIPTRDIDRNWDFTVEWDLGDLIWNDDQTSIDVRSKLMVQLRDDILDEVTRTYFERRRVQVELLTNPPGDPHVQLEKELRLQELTAMLDGLTGGWFSRQLERNRPGDRSSSTR